MSYVGIRLGADGNYDLRNYRCYAGWALLHKHVGFDLGPAQVHSFQHPLHDALFFASLPFNDRPLLFTFMWSIPQSIAAWFCFHIARLCLSPLGRWCDPVSFVAACVAGGLFGTMVCPTSERRPHHGHGLVSVQMPTLARNSTVVFLVATPASYVAAVQPDDARYIGLNNSLVQLDAKGGFQKLIEDAIGTAPGPIYGIDKTDAFFGQAEPALLRYGLRRTGWWWPIRSNTDTNLRICRLARVNKSNAWENGLEPEGHPGSL